MILQALTEYYEALLRDGKTVPLGWCQAKVAFALNLAEDGSIKGVIPLKTSMTVGKKTVWLPKMMKVPQMVSRSSGISANFLCDNSKYLLGVDKEGSNKRIRECFEASKEKHEMILEQTSGSMADAVRAFFQNWNPEQAMEHPALQEVWEEITDGSNLIFCMGVRNMAQDDPDIAEAWQTYMQKSGDEPEGICLITGQRTEIARIHTAIKGAQGAQPSGAPLVSFNASAFESYGKEQSYNAPVGQYGAFAYTTALNYLLSRRDYVFQIGDTTVVFWAENSDELYQDVFSWSIAPTVDNQETIRNIFKNLTLGRPIDIQDIELDTDQPFYILGIAPNAARLSVRFFYKDSFGEILKHISEHYQRMKLVRPSWEEREYLGLWAMIQETVNQKSRDKKPVPNMAAAVMRAILSGSRYPANLYSNVLIRIRAEQGRVTYGRAAIIKAYLIQNCGMEKGDDFVNVNEETKDPAYVLGRIFSVLETIQEEANPGINATIKDRYFNSACATPASIFPILLRLKNSHIRKMPEKGMQVYYEKMLGELIGKLSDFPKRLTLEEQGRFMLGYYHQVQKRYTKKEEV